MKKKLHIIPHSHWDREWYLPFEKHRVRLVELFDQLIRVMEENEEYTYYHMDGQVIVIEDYLEIRPKMRDRLLKLIRDGRIQVGPWYILQDEYLTSGEANIRNMLYGIRICRDLGVTPVETGYFPDAFGNISQAPQIIRGFGFDNAVFGRGVNDIGADNQLVEKNGITKSEMLWRSPDGSEVIGIMFANWYCNAMELPDEPEALKARIHEITEKAARSAETDHLLGMNGCDHQPLQKNLHAVIALANEVQDEVDVIHSNFPDYIAEIRNAKDRLSVYEGEINGQLSSGFCPLICTASSHVDIKQDNHDAQHLLERIAEPSAAIAKLSGGVYDSDYFLYAWKTLMQNHPHDSICSCSVDPIYTEMKTRFAKSIACAEQLRDNALEFVANSTDTSGIDGSKAIVVTFLEPNKLITTVETDVDFPMDEDVREIAVFDENGTEVPAKFTRIHSQFTYTLPDDRFRQPRYVDRFHIEMQTSSHGIGRHVYAVKKQSPSAKTSIRYDDHSMENETLAVKFKKNGTFDVTDKRTGHTYYGQNLFEDTRDIGNLYNYIQPEGDIAVTNEDSFAEISLFEVTPWSVTFRAKISMNIDADITSYVTLSDRVSRVDLRIVITNRSENHRIRALFPSELETTTVLSEGQFDVVRREIQPSPIWENPCYCQRCQAFVTLEDDHGTFGLMAANRGLCEYEVLRDGHNTLAVTLLRCTGDVGDWGVFPSPLGQKLGTYTLEYALIPYAQKDRAAAYALGYTFAGSAITAIQTEKHCGALTPNEGFVKFDNEFIRMSAFKKAEDSDHMILRFFNTDTTETMLNMEIPCFRFAAITDLAEHQQAELPIINGQLALPVPAKKIVTLELW